MSDHEPDDAIVTDLKQQLAVEELDTDLYRGAATPQAMGRVFGGQVIAQALAAASASIGDGRCAHSLHAYFLRAGDNAKPIIYRVLRDFDGGSFANRRVVAMQDGKPILNLAASFQRQEDGLSHHAEMPGIPGPEHAIPISQLIERRLLPSISVSGGPQVRRRAETPRRRNTHGSSSILGSGPMRAASPWLSSAISD
jgi:acyl-CoA thioesterase-2